MVGHAGGYFGLMSSCLRYLFRLFLLSLKHLLCNYSTIQIVDIQALRVQVYHPGNQNMEQVNCFSGEQGLLNEFNAI